MKLYLLTLEKSWTKRNNIIQYLQIEFKAVLSTVEVTWVTCFECNKYNFSKLQIQYIKIELYSSLIRLKFSIKQTTISFVLDQLNC